MIRRAGETGQDGRFVLNGIQAIPGDKISVLVSNNGVVQAEYLISAVTAPALRCPGTRKKMQALRPGRRGCR